MLHGRSLARWLIRPVTPVVAANMLEEIVDRHLTRWQPETALVLAVLLRAFEDAAGPAPKEPKWSRSAAWRATQQETYAEELREYRDALEFFADGRVATWAGLLGLDPEDFQDMIDLAFSAVGKRPDQYLKAA